MSDAILKFDGTTRVPEMLIRFPQTRSVLDRYGLHGCGGANGPAESIRFFARAHGVDEVSLLQELRESAADEPAALSMPAIESRVDDTIYRRFFTAAIAVVLTAGATWGAWMLYKIGVVHDFTGVSIFQINAHGHAQIFGWVGLFIMGFAYQAFPRQWQTRLVAPHLAVAVFVAMLIGLTVKTIGLAAPDTRWGAVVALGGGVAEVIAITVFAAQIGQTFRRSRAQFDPWVGFIGMALVFFVVQSGLDTWHAWTTMIAASQERLLWYVATYQAPLRDLQLHGMALLMILGVNQRLLPGIYNLKPISRRRAWWALAVLTTAVIGEVVIFIAYRWSGDHAVAAFLMLPWAMLAVGTGMIALPWKLWRPFRDINGEVDRCAKFIRLAYAWLALSLAMLLLLPVYQFISRIPFSHAYYGAIRHAFTVGFVSLMMMGFAAKVVPTLNGIDSRTLSKLWGPFLLINLGCFLRVSLQILTDWNSRAFSLVGISGVLEVTALAWWGIGLFRIMSQGKRQNQQEDVASGAPPMVVASNHKVAQVLRWFPDTEAVFRAHGFSEISNPLLRRTLASQVSVAQAAAMRGVALPLLLSDLNNLASKAGGQERRNRCKGCGC